MAICGLSDGLNLASKTLLSNSSHVCTVHLAHSINAIGSHLTCA